MPIRLSSTSSALRNPYFTFTNLLLKFMKLFQFNILGSLTVSVTQTSGGSPQQPSTEGDTVELTCTVNSTSLPAAYRPKIYYQWYVTGIGALQNISSGPATRATYGDSVPGYSIKDDGKTLVIAAAQYRDTGTIYCYVKEQWSAYWYSYSFSLPLRC